MKKIKFFSHQIKNYTYNVIFKKILITLAKRLLYSIHINCPYQESTYYLQKNQTLDHYQMKKSQVLFSQALLFFFSPFICPTLAFYLVGVSESHRFILKCSIIVTSIVYQSTFFGGGDRANKREKKTHERDLTISLITLRNHSMWSSALFLVVKDHWSFPWY